MAVSSETIEIRLSGLTRLQDLETTLGRLNRLTDSVRDGIAGINSELEQSSNAARTLARTERLSRATIDSNTAYTDPATRRATGTPLSASERRRRQRQSDEARADIARSQSETRILGSRIGQLRSERRRQTALQQQYAQEVEDATSQRNNLIAELNDISARSIRELRTTATRTRVRATRSLISARQNDALRLGGSPFIRGADLTSRDQAITRDADVNNQQLTRLERNLRASRLYTLRRVRPLQQERRAARRSGNTTMEKELTTEIEKLYSAFNDESRQSQATRYALTVDLGRLNQRRRSLSATGRGRSSVSRAGESIRQRARALQEIYGVTDRQLTIDLGEINPETNRRVRTPINRATQLASYEANLRNNISGAKDINTLAAQRITFLERELGLNNNIQSAEQRRLLTIQRLTDRLTDFQTAGASGERFQAFEQLVQRLRGMTNSRDMPAFNRLVAEADAAAARVAVPKGYKRGPSSPIRGETFIPGSEKNIAARDIGALTIEELQQKLEAARRPGQASFAFQRAESLIGRLQPLADANNFRQLDSVVKQARKAIGFVTRENKSIADTTAARTEDEKEIEKLTKKVLSGKRLEASEIDRLNALRPPASALPALPPAAPGAAALGGRARPLRTQSTIGGVVQPLIQEILGGGRTIEDAELSKRFADSFAVKAGKKAGPKFAQAFVAGAADSFSARQLLSSIGSAFGVLSEKSLSKTAGQAVKLESGVARVANALTDAARANEFLERAAAKSAAVQTGAYDDKDLKAYIDSLYRIEDSASRILNTGKSALKDFDRQLAVAKETSNRRERANTLINKSKVLEFDLLAAQSKGVDTSAQSLALQKAVAAVRADGVGISLRNLNLLESEVSASEQLLKVGRAQLRAERAGSAATPLPSGQLALPDEKLLNAAARGIKRLTTNQENFDNQVQSGIRYQEKFNREQERLRKIYGTTRPAGTGPTVRGALDPQAAQRRLSRDLLAGERLIGKLENLERKRTATLGEADPRTAEVTRQVVKLQTELNAAKQDTFELTKQNLDALTATVNKSRQLLELDTEQNRLASETAKIRRMSGERRLPQLQRNTLTSGLGELARSATADKVFLGGRSGEQALSDIVKTFNKSIESAPKRDSRGRLIGQMSASGYQADGFGVAGPNFGIPQEVAPSAAAAAQNVIETFSTRLAAGASSSAAAGIKFAGAGVEGIKKAFGIKSPSKVMIETASNIIDTFISEITKGAPRVRAAFELTFASVKKAPIFKGQLGAPSEMASQVANFLGRSSTRPSVYRPLARLAGDSVLSSPAVTEAAYRRTYEKGSLIPTLYTTTESRRANRGMFGVPGANLEKQILSSAISAASKTGAFVGPLASLTPGIGGQSLLNPGVLMSRNMRIRGKMPKTPNPSYVKGLFSAAQAQGAGFNSPLSSIFTFGKPQGAGSGFGSGITSALSGLQQALQAQIAAPMNSASRKAQEVAAPIKRLALGFQSTLNAVDIAIQSTKTAEPAAREISRQVPVLGLNLKQIANEISGAIAAGNILSGVVSNSAQTVKSIATQTGKSIKPVTQTVQGAYGRPRNLADKSVIDSTPSGTQFMPDGMFLGKPFVPSSIVTPYVPSKYLAPKTQAAEERRQKEIAALEASNSTISAGGSNVNSSIQSLFRRIATGISSAGKNVSTVSRFDDLLRSAGISQNTASAGGGARPPIPPTGPSGTGGFGARLEGARGDAGKLLGLKDLANLSAATTNQLELLAKELSDTRATLSITDKSFSGITKTLNRVNDQIARRDPNADFLTRSFGQKNAQGLSEGLIGGAFPLLFGQGLGASVGGGLGGFFGGRAGGMLGFGMSLIGTSIGSQVDALMQATQDTGNMLRDLVGNFDQIRESGLLASRSQERLITNLLEAGNKTAAYSIIQDELNAKLGVDGAAKLREAADAGDRLRRAMADLGVQMQLFIAGPLTEFLNKISAGLERKNLENRFGTLVRAATPEQKAVAREQVNAATERAKGAQSPLDMAGNFLRTILVSATVGANTGLADVSTPELREIVDILSRSQPAPKQSKEQPRQQAINDAETRQAAAQRELEVFTKRNEGLDILKGFKQQANAIKREQEDIDRQSFELRRDYERQIGDIRRGIEDKIAQIRQESAQRELEILASQGQLAEQEFRNAAATLQQQLAGNDIGQGLADAVTVYLGAQLSAQNEIEQRRKQFEVEIKNQQVELEKYKIEVARNISQLNISTAERVQEINRGVARRNEDITQNSFAIEKKSAILRLRVANEELTVLDAKQRMEITDTEAQKARNPGNPLYQQIVKEQRARLDEITSALEQNYDARSAIFNMQAPPRLREISAVSAKTPNTSGVSDANTRLKQLSRQLLEFKNQVTESALSGDAIQFATTVGKFATEPLNELFKRLNEARKSLAEVADDFSLATKEIRKYYEDTIEVLSKDPKIKLTPAMYDLIAMVAKAQLKLEEIRPTIDFYESSFNDISSATKDAEQSISELLRPISYYDAALQQLQKRGGIGINDEYNKQLLDAAKNLDNLNIQLKILNGLNDIAAGFTDSFIQLNKELIKGGNLLKSVEQFTKDVADKTLDVVLEFTLRPIQEKMFKDMAARLGIEGPQDPLLKPINNIDKNIAALVREYQRSFGNGAAQVSAQNNIVSGPTVVTPQAAMNAAAGPVATPATTMSGRYVQGMTGGGSSGPHFDLKRADGAYFNRTALDNYAEVNGAPLSSGLTVSGGTFYAPRDGRPYHGGWDYAFGNGASMGLKNGAKWISNKPGTSIGDISAFMLPDGSVYKVIHGRFKGEAAPVTPVAQQSAVAQAAAGPIPLAVDPYKDAPAAQPVTATQPVIEQQAERTVNALREFDDALVRASQKLNATSEASTTVAETATSASRSVANTGDKLSEAATKFQMTVGTGLQLITGIAMGIGGAQMIRKGGAYNTLMGAASIFGSISSVTGAFGSGGLLSGLFRSGAPSATNGISGSMANSVKKIGSNFNLKRFANGGRPDPYEPAWVGENGPEIWMPDRPGTIIPTEDIYVPGLDDTGSDAPPIGRYARRAASGSTSDNMVSSDTEYTGNFGRAVPYQRTDTSREIDRLERVATSPKELPPIKYETTRVNDYEFVTPDQLEASNARTAKMARNQTLREIADSVKLRKSLGI